MADEFPYSREACEQRNLYTYCLWRVDRIASMTPSENTDCWPVAKPFTTEQNDEVYKRLVSGDEKARDEMIEGNMALVVYRVDAYLRSAPQMAYYRDDMISAGWLDCVRLWTACRRRGRSRIQEPTGWITKGIDCHIITLVDEANTIVVPKMSATGAPGQKVNRSDHRESVSDKALLAWTTQRSEIGMP